MYCPEFINFIVEVQEIYPDIWIAEGLRTIEKQNILFHQGRNGSGDAIVTNAKGGESFRNYGLAIDIGRITNNKRNYDIDWKRVEDKPHF